MTPEERKAYNKEWRLRNVEHRREYARKWRNANLDTEAIRQSKFKESHPNYFNSYMGVWRDQNREHYRKYQREYQRRYKMIKRLQKFYSNLENYNDPTPF